MDKTLIGLLFILAGVSYGSLALDGVYDATLGYLVENKWLNPPVNEKSGKSILGRKPTIVLYSIILIIIGIYILWNRKI
jgi:hypothetical protein